MKNYNMNHTYMQVHSAQIFSDPAYQRAVDFKRVQKIVAHFNPALVNPVKVSTRDGKYYVFDGQHTLAALKVLNGNKDLMVECKIYTGLTQQDEALLFSEQNGIARIVHSNAKMKALYTAGDVGIIELHDAITSQGLKFDFSKAKANYKITACVTIQKIFKKTSASEFEMILHIIKTAWEGDAESFNKEILAGMYVFCNVYKGQFLIKKAIDQFHRANPRVIIRDGKVSGTGGDTRFARQLVYAYNKKNRTGKLDEQLLTWHQL